MDRNLQGTATTARFTLLVDGVATAADATPTVTCTRLDGTVVFSALTASTVSTGVYGITLTPAHTALLDTLTLTWSYTRGGAAETQRTYVEVVGGFLCSLAELRRRLPDTSLYTDADLAAARVVVEQELEAACGVAFVPRYTRDRYPLTRRGIRLRWSEAYLVRDAAFRTFGQASYSLTAPQLANVTVDATNRIVWGVPFGWTWGEVTLGYEHGLSHPPEAARIAALDLAQYVWAPSQAAQSSAQGIDPRATRIVTQDGTIELAAGGGGAFGLPSADALVVRYGAPQVA